MKSKAVDYLKCIAALLVINTHITVLYPPKLGFLAWGGFFANSIFFFVSGYCLTSVNRSFPKWYMRRFIRVYIPYIIMLPLLFFAGRLAGWNTVNIIMPFEEYHFIPTILLLYIVYYFLSKVNQKTKIGYSAQVAALTAIAILYYILIFDKVNGYILEHFTFIETISYLIPLLLGGMAKEGKWIRSKLISGILIVFSFALYVYQSFRGFPDFLKILQPCIGLFFAYALGCFFLSVEDKLPQIIIIEFISAVTLECYLVQFISLDAFTNTGFPTNIVYHVSCTLAVAYCLHWCSDIIVKRINKLIEKPMLI